MYAVDEISYMSATSVINVCDELGLPAGLSLLAGLMTGCKVSVKAGKYVFEDAADHIVKEVDADGLRVLLKESGINLDDLMGVGKKTIKTLSDEEVEELAFQAIKGADKADVVVLGKYKYILDDSGNRIATANSYNIITIDMGAQYFEIDNWDELANLYGEDQLWKINEKFLDIQIASGRDIYLSTDPENIIDLMFFMQENCSI